MFQPSKSVTRVEAATTPDSEAVDMTSRQPRPSPRPSPRMAHKPLKVKKVVPEENVIFSFHPVRPTEYLFDTQLRSTFSELQYNILWSKYSGTQKDRYVQSE